MAIPTALDLAIDFVASYALLIEAKGTAPAEEEGYYRKVFGNAREAIISFDAAVVSLREKLAHEHAANAILKHTNTLLELANDSLKREVAMLRESVITHHPNCALVCDAGGPASSGLGCTCELEEEKDSHRDMDAKAYSR